ALAEARALTGVELANNNLTSDDAIAFANALSSGAGAAPRLPPLLALELRDNPRLGDAGVRALVATARCRALESLGLARCGLVVEPAASLAAAAAEAAVGAHQ